MEPNISSIDEYDAILVDQSDIEIYISKLEDEDSLDMQGKILRLGKYF